MFRLDAAPRRGVRRLRRVASAVLGKGDEVRPGLAALNGQDFVPERHFVVDRGDFRVGRPAGKLGSVGCTFRKIDSIIAFEHGQPPFQTEFSPEEGSKVAPSAKRVNHISDSTDRKAPTLAQIGTEGWGFGSLKADVLALQTCYMRSPFYDDRGALLRATRRAVRDYRLTGPCQPCSRDNEQS